MNTYNAGGAGTNGYPIPDPNPKYFSIPDPYPINFQNHRVFRVSGIRENQVFVMNPCALVWILTILSSLVVLILTLSIFTTRRDVFLDNNWQQGWYWMAWPSKNISCNTWCTSLGSVLGQYYTPARTNIRHTSLRGKHWQCSNNNANRHNKDIFTLNPCRIPVEWNRLTVLKSILPW